MAWTAPTTRTAGELITASIWNTDLVENLKYLKGTPALTGFTTSGQALVGVSSARSLGSLDALLQVETAGSTYSQFSVVVNRNDTGGAGIVLGKSRGTTTGSNTIVADADNVGFIRFNAADGVDLDSNVAQILAQIDGTPGSNDTPGRLTFWTTADGAASVTERLRITQAGNLAIAATAKLHFDGVAGTGDTYIAETSANVLSLYSGNVEAKLTSGVLTVSGGGAHTFGAAVASGTNAILASNTSATGYSGKLGAYADNSTYQAQFVQFGANYPTSTWDQAKALAIQTNGDAGLSIAATHASGDVRGYAGGTTQKFAIKASDGHTYTDNGSVYSLSDLRYKTRLGDFTRGLADLIGLYPAIYQHNPDTGMPVSAGPFVSLGAQDVEPWIPEAVSIGPDGKYGLSSGVLVYALINATRELHAEWQQHDAELSALRARVAELEGKLAA